MNLSTLELPPHRPAEEFWVLIILYTRLIILVCYKYQPIQLV